MFFISIFVSESSIVTFESSRVSLVPSHDQAFVRRQASLKNCDARDRPNQPLLAGQALGQTSFGLSRASADASFGQDSGSNVSINPNVGAGDFSPASAAAAPRRRCERS